MFEKLCQVLRVLARCIRWVFGLYRNAHRENLLLRAWRSRKVSAPKARPQPESSGNVVKFPQRASSSAKPSVAVQEARTPNTGSALAAFGDISLGVVASWTAIGMVSLLIHASSGGTSDRVITTGANETTATALPGGGTVTLGARSTLQLGVADQHCVGRLMEGEAMFQVPLDAPALAVETFLATAKAAPGSKFRAKIDSSVEFELYAGVVDVFPRDANGKPAKVTLRIGIPYRVPVDIRRALVASCCGGVAAKPVDG